MLSVKLKELLIPNGSVFKEVSFTVSAGEVWGIIGMNAVGKTTLLHTLAGLNPLYNEDILFSGQPLASFTRLEIAQRIGILLQEDKTYFDLSVLDYCQSSCYPHASTDKNKFLINEALSLTQLQDKKKSSLRSLSGGEKRRLNIAALLVQNPLLYLLDEPTNHLDYFYANNLLNFLVNNARRNSKAIIMISHDLQQAISYCDYIIALTPDGIMHIESSKSGYKIKKLQKYISSLHRFYTK